MGNVWKAINPLDIRNWKAPFGALYLGKVKTQSESSPTIGAIRFQQSTYGTVVPLVFGTSRISGNIIDYNDFTAIPHTTSTETPSGGKGGGGKTVQSNTSYTYRANILIGLCQGTINNVLKIWREKEIVSLSSEGFSLFTGSPSQIPWGTNLTYHPDKALNYRNLAYVAGNLDLGPDGGVSNYTFEIQGCNVYGINGIIDSNPADIITTLLTNPVYGAAFPISNIEPFNDFSNYCIANGLFVSPAYTSQTQCQEMLTELSNICNSSFIWSQGKLKLVPAGDVMCVGNGVTWSPNVTPIYDLTDDDYISSDYPVTCSRSTQADTYNSVKLEFLNSANSYNVEVVEIQDQANKEIYGERPADTIQAHLITNSVVAHKVAQMALDRIVVFRNHYTFSLSLNYILLEAMDIVTITDIELGLAKELVRIIAIKEGADDTLEFEVQELCVGTANTAIYAHQEAIRHELDYNVDSGTCNNPIIIEPSFELTDSALQIWIGLSGVSNTWGGALVWISEDDTTYRNIGKITSPCRQGVVSSSIPISESPDTIHKLNVDLSISRSSLLSGTKNDADNLNTLCYCKGEFIAYQTASPISEYKYELDYLVRGAYNTKISELLVGDDFVRIDKSSFFRYNFFKTDIGKVLYIKFQSYNIFGANLQDLATVSPNRHKLRGDALLESPEDINNFTFNYSDGFAYLRWDSISDIRSVVYEVRQGTSWELGTILARVPGNTMVIGADGKYWVKAYIYDGGIYSQTPASLIIQGARYLKNYLISHDEKLTGWPGQLTNCFITENGCVEIIDTSIPGYYEIPQSHIVNTGRECMSNITYSYTVGNNVCGLSMDLLPDIDSLPNFEQNFGESFDLSPDIDSLTDFEGENAVSYQASVSNSRVQIALAGMDGIFREWQDLIPGQYFAKLYKLRVALFSSIAWVTPTLKEFTFTVDMPDVIETKTGINIPAEGIDVLYDKMFQIIPNTQITIIQASPQDCILLTNESNVGYTIQITNSGTGVSRSINSTSIGY